MDDSFKLYTFRYYYSNERQSGYWEHSIAATSEEDARKRFRLLHDGELVSRTSLPENSKVKKGWFRRLFP